MNTLRRLDRRPDAPTVSIAEPAEHFAHPRTGRVDDRACRDAMDRAARRVGQLDTLHLHGPVVTGRRHESRHAGVVAGVGTEGDGVEEILEQQALRVHVEHLGDDEGAEQVDGIEPRHGPLHL